MATGTSPKSSIVDRIGLGWFLRLLSSSVGQKFVMGITGLLLCGFVAAHLAGNMLLFLGAAWFNDYAHKLHENWELLVIAETSLLVLFLMHVYLAIATTIGNAQARDEQYSMKQSKIPGRVINSSSSMFITGAIVLGFVLLHLVDLRLARAGINLRGFKYAGKEHFDQVLSVLRNNVSRMVYVVGAIALGVHLSHGFASAFQSLGLNHPKYMPLIKWVGTLFGIVVAIGFASIAVFVPEIWRH